MALGGGTFVTQNKVLPGSYINFISAARASAALSDRGIAAVPMVLNWGVDGDVFKVESADLQKDSLTIFGYDYTAPELKDVREVFRHAKEVLFFKLNGGDKAAVTTGVLTATAKYKGTRGNDLRIVISANIDDPTKKDVLTYLGARVVDTQIATNAEELVANSFVVFSGTGALADTAGANLIGGTNAAVTGTEHQLALDKLESFGFNTLVCVATDGTTIGLYAAYTERMRDDVGAKFQTVVYRNAADYEGVISVENTVKDVGASAASLVYWVGGIQAAAPINGSTTNKKYDGEYEVDVDYKQSELSANLSAGKYMIHRVGEEVRILSDINTFVSFTEDKNSDFSSNQVIRVLDNIANDIALLFNTKYLGDIQNDAAGRISFWGDIVAYNRQLEVLRAIQNFVPDEVKVEQGVAKNAVAVTNPVEVVVAMEKLYMTVLVS